MMIAPEPPPEYGDAALAAELANREELDDPLLHVLETGVILIEDAPCLGEVEVVLGSDVPGDLEHPVEIGPDPAVLRALLAGPLEAVQLALDLLANVLGHARLLEARPVAGDNIVATLAELLLDRLELLAQQEVALGLLHPLVDLGPHLLAHRCVGEDVLGPSDEAGEALLDVERLQHLELLLDAEVRRVAGEVGEVAGVTNRPHRLDGAARAAELQEVLDERAVLARQLASAVSRLAVWSGSTCTQSAPPMSGLPATETRTVQSLEDRAPRRRMAAARSRSTCATVPIPENRPPTRGTSRIRWLPLCAAVIAARWVSLSTATVAVIPGMTTTSSSWRIGRSSEVSSAIFSLDMPCAPARAALACRNLYTRGQDF